MDGANIVRMDVVDGPIVLYVFVWKRKKWREAIAHSSWNRADVPKANRNKKIIYKAVDSKVAMLLTRSRSC